jgi:hypothetical protein
METNSTNKVTRVEVIDENGRSYVNWNDNNKVELSFQDEGKTLKVFINNEKMTEQKQDSLQLYIFKKTGGRYDPRLVKELIECLEEWLPQEQEPQSPMDFFMMGYNDYRRTVTQNLRWNSHGK